MEYGRLRGLHVKDYQHPGEDVYMKALKAIPLYDKVVRLTLRMQVDFSGKADAVGNYCRITEKTNPRVYHLYQTALERLDMSKEYPLYSKLSYDYNAAAYGEEFIYIHTSLINDCSDEELLSVIGHEIGHIKSGHALYQNMATNIGSLINKLGILGLPVAASLSYAIMQWSRCAEYTCDRAGVIAAGNYEAGIRVQAKLMGVTQDIPHLFLDERKLLSQTDDLSGEVQDNMGKLLYAFFTAQQNHPWSPLRIRELKKWQDSGEFSRIIERYNK